MNKKVISYFLTATLILAILVGCNPKKQPANDSSNDIPSSTEVSALVSSTSKPDSYQIDEDVFLTPVPVIKPGDKMTDDEIIEMAYNLIKAANTVWGDLYFGIDNLSLDEDDSIQHDGEIWYRVKYINSLKQYEEIVDSVCAESIYDDIIYSALSLNMFERNGHLYHCKSRTGSGSGDTSRTVLSVVVLRKEAEKIAVRVTAKGIIHDATIVDVLTYNDGDLLYTFTVQNGNWVLNSLYGESVKG